MEIFDLHNDALTVGASAAADNVIYAVWTSELTPETAKKLLVSNADKLLAIEDCGVFFNDYSSIPSFKPLYAGLTWNGENAFAGGAHSSVGLKDAGRALIDCLNAHNIVVDTAHLSENSFDEVAERANRIICSHTCFSEVNKHVRNLTRAQISAIISRGGVVGLCLVTEFLGGTTTYDVIRHIDWFLDAFGDSHLAFGTDFNGTTKLPEGLHSYEDFGALYELLLRRYSENTVKKIFYGNAAAYFKR